ncbi:MULTISPECIES: hypothetical protein [Microtetraspora]|uniref:Uncharacterized protein n=1 Tax=Microtetraspora glauca TaxID=1996 RepID=A0ABV3GBA2_MICGL|nr:hypothetical protein [Microtetraspora sp. AC03309]MCC5580211.1 hypothetical protein [Microtetraspora sp. AC03309]
MNQRSPEMVAEETRRVKAKLIRMYGWDGYQRVMKRMESDLARLERESGPEN